MRKAVVAAAGLAGLGLAQPAFAQMISPMLYNGPAISLQSHANRSQSTTPSVSNTPATTASLTYRPDPARRRANLAQFVEKMRAIDPKGAANLAAMFAQGDFLERIQSDLRPMGLRIDNVADAYATYWLCAWQASRGDSSTPARPIIDAVKAQAGEALRATPVFAQAGNALKQDMAESIWIQMALLDSVADGAKGDPEQLRLVRQAALQGALGMGLDLEGMTLTDQGFVAKEG